MHLHLLERSYPAPCRMLLSLCDPAARVCHHWLFGFRSLHDNTKNRVYIHAYMLVCKTLQAARAQATLWLSPLPTPTPRITGSKRTRSLPRPRAAEAARCRTSSRPGSSCNWRGPSKRRSTSRCVELGVVAMSCFLRWYRRPTRMYSFVATYVYLACLHENK